jgi:hypothetical protein
LDRARRHHRRERGEIGQCQLRSASMALCQRVFDAYDIPSRASASYDRSRMMRLQYGPQSGYARLVHRALKSWMELEQVLETRLYCPSGVCVWSATAESWTAATSAALADVGIEYREATFDAHTGRILNRSALGRGVYTQEGGVLLADRALILRRIRPSGRGADQCSSPSESIECDAAR